MASKAPVLTGRINGQGFRTLEGGMDGGNDPGLIGENQVAAMCNMTVRGGLIAPRNPFANLLLTPADSLTASRMTGQFQGAMFYQAETGNDGFIYSQGGKLFRIQVGLQNIVSEITPRVPILVTANFAVPMVGSNVTISITSETPFSVNEQIQMNLGIYEVVTLLTDQLVVQYLGGAISGTVFQGTSVLTSTGSQIYNYQTNPANADFIFLFQAENYAIVCGGQNKTVFYDGANSRQAAIGELPPALFGVYLWGRVWLTLNDRRSFVAGDIVYGESGTDANGHRDAILSMTENNLLAGGGAFTVPNNAGLITSMFTLATLDTSLGIGPVLIGTTNSVVSCDAPPDRATWSTLTFPIETISVLDYGPTGPWSVAPVNSDSWYRSLDGIRSFTAARLDYNTNQQTPLGFEVSNILDEDSEDLLFHASALNLNGRLYVTTAPYFTPYGTPSRGMVVVNFDDVSGLREKLPPCWEGATSGLQILQLVKGRINSIERGFAFVLNGAVVELWELDTEGIYDLWTVPNGTNTSIARTSINSFLETRRDDFNDDDVLKRLYTGILYLDEITDNVSITVKYRPDEYPDWATWTTLNLCASVSQCAVPFSPQFHCNVFKTKRATYAARVLLTMPPEAINALTNGFLHIGYSFQFRFEFTGKFRFRKWMPVATVMDDKVEGECPAKPTCVSFASCNLDWFGYDSHGMTTQATGTVTIPQSVNGSTVTGLNLPFTPSGGVLTVTAGVGCTQALFATFSSIPTTDGFSYTLTGITNGPCYILNYLLFQ